MQIPLRLTLVVFVAMFSACSRGPAQRLDHEAYVWQRQWTPPIAASIDAMRGDFSGWRVLADHYGANLNRVVVPKGNAGRLAYVSEFVEYVKASGLVQKAIDRDGTFAFQVPPPGDPR